MAAGFAARRRNVRSSGTVRILLAAGLLFFILLSWYSNALFSNSDIDASRRRGDLQPAIMKNTDSSVGVSIPPESSLNMDISSTRSSLPLRLVSFNIRYATDKPVVGEHLWSVRGPRLCGQLQFITEGHENAFLTLQEALHSQVQDIQAYLGDSWSHIGRGRGNRETEGEFSPIFYRSDTWNLERSETRWLSQTPGKPSRGWDAALPRIATIGEFSHKGTGTIVVVISTHFDHKGVKARQNSAKLLIQFAQEWRSSSKGGAPSAVLIGGDFNSTPDDDAYRTITARGSGISDISDLVPEGKRYGNTLTYTSFGEPNEWPQRIDFLFIQEPRSARIKSFGVLANNFDDHIRISDHRAVVADLDIAV